MDKAEPRGQRSQLEFQRLALKYPVMGPWVTCTCRTSYRTERCPTCEPTVRRIGNQPKELVTK